MDKTNLERLQNVADGLDELNEKVVYVGGSVAQLYVNDEAFQDYFGFKNSCLFV